MPWIIALLLVIISGGVAAAGDYMGQRAARRKLRIGKLRPRYVSRLIAVISGVLISLVTYGAMFFLYSDFRNALTHYKQVKSDYDGLKHDSAALQTQISSANTEIKGLQENKIQLVAEADTARRDRDQAIAERDKANSERDKANSELAVTRQQIASADAKLKQLNQRLAQANKTLSATRGSQVRALQKLNDLRVGDVIIPHDTVLNRIDIKAADVGQRDSKLRSALAVIKQQVTNELHLALAPETDAQLEKFIANYPYANPAADSVAVISVPRNVIAGEAIPLAFSAVPVGSLIKEGAVLLTLHISDKGVQINARGLKPRVVTFAAGINQEEIEKALGVTGSEFNQAMETIGFIPPENMSQQELAQAVGQIADLGPLVLEHERPYQIQMLALQDLTNTDWPVKVKLNIFKEPGS